jgi:hypothetical protein
MGITKMRLLGTDRGHRVPRASRVGLRVPGGAGLFRRVPA